MYGSLLVNFWEVGEQINLPLRHPRNETAHEEVIEIIDEDPKAVSGVKR